MQGIKLERKGLIENLNSLLRVLDRKSIEPISSFVFFFPGFIASSDGKTSMKISMKTESELKEGFGVQHKRLLEVLRASGENEVEIIFDPENLWVSIISGKLKGSLPGIPGDAFPVDFEEPEKRTTIPLDVLSEAVEKVVYAAPSGSSSFGTDGVKMHIGGGVIFSIATDGFRLAYYERVIGVDTEPLSFVIPKRVARSLPRLFKGDAVSVSQKGTEVFFSDGERTLISSTYEDTFPKDMENLKSKVGESLLTLRREELVTALKEIKAFDEKGLGAKLIMSPREPVVLRFEEEQGRAEIELSGEFVGEPMELVVDEKGLIEILNNLSEPNVKLEFFGEKSPIMIKESGDNFLYINLATPLTEGGY